MSDQSLGRSSPLRTEGDDHDPIAALAQLAHDAGRPDLAIEAQVLAERTAAGRFYVACVGQFKRGKSTLLNALVGRPILPVGVVPVTSAVTVLRFGPELRARVRFVRGQWRAIEVDALAQLVSEAENPENAKGVAAVEVMLPSPLLASGMCLVDTPGIGSVFAGNSAVTREFVPQIDAALVVVGGDPPISGDELNLVADVSRHVGQIIFVLNKADRLDESERKQAVDFTRKITADRLGHATGPLLEISATERLAGRETRDWRRLESQLLQLAKGSGAQLARTAQTRGLQLLGARLLRELDEHLGALRRPLGESEQRIATLKQCADEAETALRELGLRLTAEQERINRAFAARREGFVGRAIPEARRELVARLREAGERGPALRRRAIALAQELAERRIEPQLADEDHAAAELYRDSMGRFVDLANDFFTRLARSGAPGLTDLPGTLAAADLSRERHFFRHELLAIVPQSIWTRLVDRLRPRRRALAAIAAAAGNYLERMIDTNGARIQNDLVERVLESRRRLESRIRTRLQEASSSAERALIRARARHAEGADAVRAEVERIQALREQTEVLQLARAS
jgi:hypothetical protein